MKTAEDVQAAAAAKLTAQLPAEWLTAAPATAEQPQAQS